LSHRNRGNGGREGKEQPMKENARILRKGGDVEIGKKIRRTRKKGGGDPGGEKKKKKKITGNQECEKCWEDDTT